MVSLAFLSYFVKIASLPEKENPYFVLDYPLVVIYIIISIFIFPVACSALVYLYFGNFFVLFYFFLFCVLFCLYLQSYV